MRCTRKKSDTDFSVDYRPVSPVNLRPNNVQCQLDWSVRATIKLIDQIRQKIRTTRRRH